MTQNLTVEQFDEYVERFKTVTFTTLSALKQLEQVNKLISEKNRILLQNPVLFRTLQRTISQSAIVNAAMFTDQSNGAFSLHTLARYLQTYKRTYVENDSAKIRQVDEVLSRVKNLMSHAVREKIKRLRDKIYGHINRELVEQAGKYKEFIAQNDISWLEVRKYLEEIGDILNQISGALLDKGTVMGIIGDDITYVQFKGLEEALLTEDWVGYKASAEVEQEARKYVEKRLKSKSLSS